MPHFDFCFWDSGIRFDTPDAHPTHMRTLSHFLDVPFDDASIGLFRLVSFTTDNVQRMKANNVGHQFDERITATTSALTLLEAQDVDDETKLALRKARKQGKTEFRDALPARLAVIAAAITVKYGTPSQPMTECFPLGRTKFSNAGDDDLKKHLQTLQNGITAHATDLGPTVVADTAALVNGWAAVYVASEEAGGAKTFTQEAKKLARENLSLMLFLNLLKIAEIYPRQPEKLALYMTQSLLETHTPAATTEPPTPPAPTPSALADKSAPATPQASPGP